MSTPPSTKAYTCIVIDVGSSSIKAYGISDSQAIMPIFSKSVSLKDDFDRNTGISAERETELFGLVNQLQKNYLSVPIKVYATALFRKLTPDAKKKFQAHFLDQTGIDFHIVSHEKENYYLEQALLHHCHLAQPVLLINVGGGSTELVVMFGKQAVEKQNAEIGIGTILTDFGSINNQFSGVPLSAVVEYVDKLLPPLTKDVEIAFYSGGELHFMQIMNYPLQPNTLFEDPEHPSIITTEDYRRMNEKIFSQVTMEELENAMPQNPKWMHGARACCAISQAIMNKYGIATIIPSDANLVHGIVRAGEC